MMRSIPMRARPLLLVALLLTFTAHAASLDTLSHLHGLAFDPADSNRLLLATHQGLYRVHVDGRIERVGRGSDDYMALTSDPSTPGRLYASGHPTGGGNLGLLRSDDGGANWQKWSDGYSGPVDFHQLAVSRANPDVLYGVHGTLQQSTDGGRNWRPGEPPPDKLIALAASAREPERLYAATEQGLRVSLDGGRNWRPAVMFRSPASLVQVTKDGTVYAFLLGRGLLRTTEPSLAWETVYNGFGVHYPLQMAVASDNPRRLAVLTHRGKLFVSDDAGASWQRFGLPIRSGAATNGARGFAEYCSACHGKEGVGETVGSPTAPKEANRLAPPLDSSTHAWHHDDAQLQKTINEGTLAQGGRMPAWNSLLGKGEVTDLIAYIKSLWGARERACQGAKHMNCDWSPEG